MKVMTIVGTRPELIKLSLIIAEMDRTFDHVLVHTGQNFDFELNEIFFRDLKIRKPDQFLNCAAATAIQTIAQVLIRAEDVLLKENPDALLIYGDTNSCLAAIAAKKLRVPIFHMEAGNRCFDERVPEEINRRLLDHLCDINMPLTEHGRRYLLNEGIPPQRVIKTGSCMTEILHYFKGNIAASTALEDLRVKSNEYFVVSLHREENVDSVDNLKKLLASLDQLVKDHKKKIVFSVHPRTKLRIEALSPAWKPSPEIQMQKPLGFFDYVKLQSKAFCVLSDSGTLMEESSILGFPAVHCRDSFERPEGMEHATLILCPLDPEKISEAVTVATKLAQLSERTIVPDYNVNQVSKTVVGIIQSYTSIINKEVWRR